MTDIEESVAGFKTRGGWVDVVELGERIARALRDVDEDNPDVTVDEDALAEFEDWRPKTEERLDEDVNEKTAEQARTDEGRGEEAGKEPDEDLRTAGEKLTESYEQLDEPDEAVESWGESLDYVARAADSAGRKAIRKVEDAVYRNVMTKIAPYYFDNELVSANIQRVDRGERPEYILEININDDDLKIRVSNKLADFDEDVDRWHVAAPKDTDAVEAAEGIEVTESERAADDEGEDLDSKTT
jgi:hypothetical protein